MFIANLRVRLRADIIGWPVAFVTVWHPTGFHHDIFSTSVGAGASHSPGSSRAVHVVENSKVKEVTQMTYHAQRPHISLALCLT